MKRFLSGKTYTFSSGFSCAFRQWRAESHCKLIHGYALQFEFVFGGTDLDERNWVVDFGSLKELKGWLAYMFDHTYVVAADDPYKESFADMRDKGLLDLRVVEAVGCEKFSELAFDKAQELISEQYGDRCWVESVTVREHEANSATCMRCDDDEY